MQQHDNAFLKLIRMNKVRLFEYEGKKITFDFGNGVQMINANQMSNIFQKDPSHFLRNKHTKAFIEALKQSANLQSDQVKRTEIGGIAPGTWFHQKLALSYSLNSFSRVQVFPFRQTGQQ